MAHRSEALEVPLELNISGETYSGVPTKEQRFGFGGDNSVSLPEKIREKNVLKINQYTMFKIFFRQIKKLPSSSSSSPEVSSRAPSDSMGSSALSPVRLLLRFDL